MSHCFFGSIFEISYFLRQKNVFCEWWTEGILGCGKIFFRGMFNTNRVLFRLLQACRVCMVLESMEKYWNCKQDISHLLTCTSFFHQSRAWLSHWHVCVTLKLFTVVCACTSREYVFRFQLLCKQHFLWMLMAHLFMISCDK